LKERRFQSVRSSPNRLANDKKFIPLTDKVFAVLKSLGDSPKETLTLDQVTTAVGLAKTTVHRLLYSIKSLGYIDQEANGNYKFSERFYALGGHSLPYGPLISAARPYLKQLAAKCGEGVQVGVLEQGLMLIVAAEPSRQAYRCNGVVSDCDYAHSSAIGKCLLANLNSAERKAYLEDVELPPVTSRTITDRSQLELELERVRSQGGSINDGESVEGVTGVAAPIFGHDRQVIAAVSMTGPSNRMHLALEKRKAEVKEMAKKLSLALESSPHAVVTKRNSDNTPAA
jgi:DNA-binding IclR family transcriptional regulator